MDLHYLIRKVAQVLTMWWMHFLLVGISFNEMGFRFTYSQRTYMRTCDCEYVVDGKCAYTLLLPLNKGVYLCTLYTLRNLK